MPGVSADVGVIVASAPVAPGSTVKVTGGSAVTAEASWTAAIEPSEWIENAVVVATDAPSGRVGLMSATVESGGRMRSPQAAGTRVPVVDEPAAGVPTANDPPGPTEGEAWGLPVSVASRAMVANATAPVKMSPVRALWLTLPVSIDRV